MDKQHFNYGAWTRGRFSEAVTVTGPGKMIFLAGIGAEHDGVSFHRTTEVSYRLKEKARRRPRQQTT